MLTILRRKIFATETFELWQLDNFEPCVLNLDKLYTQMSQVFRLPRELNLLLSCFGLSALHSRIYWNSGPSLPAYSVPQQWYWHGTVRQGTVRFNLTEDASSTCLFWSCYIIYLWPEQPLLLGVANTLIVVFFAGVSQFLLLSEEMVRPITTITYDNQLDQFKV